MARSEQLFSESSQLSPGGVSSPVRAFKPYPLFMRGGSGCTIEDVDGNRYIDMCMAYGPLITGHAHPKVMEAVRDQLTRGAVFGCPSEQELALVERIHKEVPSAEMVRLACSGTEATMHAIRTARGFTGRDDIVKMRGGFHGAHDSALVAAGSGSAEGVPSSKGVLADTAKHTFTVEYNDPQAMSDVLERNDIACVIMEPVLGNVGLVPPDKGYLEEVRKITRENDVILIFDEVITGFRASSGGAQKRYGVTPDMTTMAKVIGGGFPCAAFMGRADIMSQVAPQGPVYAAGTFADSLVLETLNEDSANVAYELTFLVAGLVCGAYVLFVKREKLTPRTEAPKYIGAVCETIGQFFYIYALADSAHVAMSAPIISSYCAASVLWSRIFLKEKLSAKHYISILMVFIGIVIMGVFDM